MSLIGIDARFYGRAGPGRYTKNIIQHLEKVDKVNKYVVFLTSEGFDLYTPSNSNFTKEIANYGWYSFAEQTAMLFKVLKHNLDLYYVPHFNIPVLYPKKLITAIPDMTMHTFSTEKGTTLPLWYFRLKKVVYKLVFWWAVFRSTKVIVPSQTVLDEFISNIKGINSSKYVLAHEGVDPEYLQTSLDTHKVLEKYGITKKFILHVGSMYEHKNVEGLVDMFKILKSKYGFGGQLVLVSKKDKFSQRILHKILKENLSDDIILPAYVDKTNPKDIVVSDQEVVNLRQAALCYVFAAFTEGFSLTALEGMSLGLPAALSDIPCHREIYQDSVLYFDPKNPEEMADKVNMLLSDEVLKQSLIQKGYAQVKKYDWLTTAKITLDVFNSALNDL